MCRCLETIDVYIMALVCFMSVVVGMFVVAGVVKNSAFLAFEC